MCIKTTLSLVLVPIVTAACTLIASFPDADTNVDSGSDGWCSARDWEIGDVSTSWVTVTPGTFSMGTSDAEPISELDEIQHIVTLTRSFEIMTTEVSQELYWTVVGDDPWVVDDWQRPALRVSWHDAASFCNDLSTRDSLPSCFTCQTLTSGTECLSSYASPYDCLGYRLPTEAEWEYVARASTETPTYAVEEEPIADIAWCGVEHSQHVGTLRPNDWCLYDMLGNALEWCHDWFADYVDPRYTDPAGPHEGTERVARGGHWEADCSNSRAANRYSFYATQTSDMISFRPVRTLPD